MGQIIAVVKFHKSADDLPEEAPCALWCYSKVVCKKSWLYIFVQAN